MFLYTIVPPEEIFGEEDEVTSAQAVSVAGRMVTIRSGGPGIGTIDQLLSTDPNDFLDPRWQPGSTLSLYELLSK